MDTNKFFVWVWRFNALIIFACSGLLCAMLLWDFSRDWFRGAGDADVIVNVAKDPEDVEKWELGVSEKIRGTDYWLMPLQSKSKESDVRNTRGYGSGYAAVKNYDYGRGLAKNILFVNSESNESFWLFNDTNRLILFTSIFPQATSLKQAAPAAKAILFRVISSDTNGDSVLTTDDKAALMMSEPDGSNYREVLSGYDRIVSQIPVGENKLLIVYLVDGIGKSALIQLNPFKKISIKTLPHIDD